MRFSLRHCAVKRESSNDSVPSQHCVLPLSQIDRIRRQSVTRFAQDLRNVSDCSVVADNLSEALGARQIVNSRTLIGIALVLRCSPAWREDGSYPIRSRKLSVSGNRKDVRLQSVFLSGCWRWLIIALSHVAPQRRKGRAKRTRRNHRELRRVTTRAYYPQGDSNPCRRRERAVSWASRRWGRVPKVSEIARRATRAQLLYAAAYLISVGGIAESVPQNVAMVFGLAADANMARVHHPTT
jgi:hypothetical protein